MIDHVGIPVTELQRSKVFYEAVLASLGHGLVMEIPDYGVGFGPPEEPRFWIMTGGPVARTHVAFAAKDRATVDAFYEAAMAAGATDNGSPGIREQYHPDYYGAFVLDPDGHNIEAVCHLPA